MCISVKCFEELIACVNIFKTFWSLCLWNLVKGNNAVVWNWISGIICHEKWSNFEILSPNTTWKGNMFVWKYIYLDIWLLAFICDTAEWRELMECLFRMQNNYSKSKTTISQYCKSAQLSWKSWEMVKIEFRVFQLCKIQKKSGNFIATKKDVVSLLCIVSSLDSVKRCLAGIRPKNYCVIFKIH